LCMGVRYAQKLGASRRARAISSLPWWRAFMRRVGSRLWRRGWLRRVRSRPCRRMMRKYKGDELVGWIRRRGWLPRGVGRRRRTAKPIVLVGADHLDGWHARSERLAGTHGSGRWPRGHTSCV
jgi:hypothetical protein